MKTKKFHIYREYMLSFGQSLKIVVMGSTLTSYLFIAAVSGILMVNALTTHPHNFQENVPFSLEIRDSEYILTSVTR